MEGRQFKQAVFRKWTFICNKPNNVAVLKDGTPIVIFNFIECGEEQYVVGKLFSTVDAFYLYPIDSREIGMFRVGYLLNDYDMWPLNLIKYKAIKIPLSDTDDISSLNELDV